MDESFGSQSLMWFVRHIEQGLCPHEAATETKLTVAASIKAWNQSRKDYQVHRWLGHEDATIEHMERTLHQMTKGEKRIMTQPLYHWYHITFIQHGRPVESLTRLAPSPQEFIDHAQAMMYGVDITVRAPLHDE